METTLYNQKGKEVGKLQLPEAIFGLPWNADLVHQVVVTMQANKRNPVAHAKNRGDVSGGGKKPWRQKGTGRARHGSIRSPLWVGGGVTHGPNKNKVFERKINKKIKARALAIVLSQKFREGQVLFVDSLSLKGPKTKEAKQILTSLSLVKGYEGVLNKKNNAAYLTLPAKDSAVEKSFQNFGNLLVDEVRNLNVLDLVNTKYVVIVGPEEAFKFLSAKMSK